MFNTTRVSSLEMSLKEMLRLFSHRKEVQHNLFWSPGILPVELWYDIGDLLTLADRVALAFTCKELMRLFKHSCESLNERHSFNVEQKTLKRLQKLDFLPRLDESLPSMLFCKACFKYWSWSHSKGAFHKHGSHIRVSPGVECLEGNLQLVKRAQKYKDNRYGLPVKFLSRSFRQGEWHFATNAAIRGGGLILRVISTWNVRPKPWGKEWQKYEEALEAYAICRHCRSPSVGGRLPWNSSPDCTMEDTLMEAIQIMASTKKHAFGPTKAGTSSDEKHHIWPPHKCRWCGVFVYVELKCSRLFGYRLRIKRYHDLGPVDYDYPFPLRSDIIKGDQKVDWDRSYVRQEDGVLVYQGEWTEYARFERKRWTKTERIKGPGETIMLRHRRAPEREAV